MYIISLIFRRHGHDRAPLFRNRITPGHSGSVQLVQKYDNYVRDSKIARTFLSFRDKYLYEFCKTGQKKGILGNGTYHRFVWGTSGVSFQWFAILLASGTSAVLVCQEWHKESRLRTPSLRSFVRRGGTKISWEKLHSVIELIDWHVGYILWLQLQTEWVWYTFNKDV